MNLTLRMNICITVSTQCYTHVGGMVTFWFYEHLCYYFRLIIQNYRQRRWKTCIIYRPIQSLITTVCLYVSCFCGLRCMYLGLRMLYSFFIVEDILAALIKRILKRMHHLPLS